MNEIPQLSDLLHFCSQEEIRTGKVSVEHFLFKTLCWITGPDPVVFPRGLDQSLALVRNLHIRHLHLGSTEGEVSFCRLSEWVQEPFPRVVDVVSWGEGCNMTSYAVQAFRKLFPNATFTGLDVCKFENKGSQKNRMK